MLSSSLTPPFLQRSLFVYSKKAKATPYFSGQNCCKFSCIWIWVAVTVTVTVTGGLQASGFRLQASGFRLQGWAYFPFQESGLVHTYTGTYTGTVTGSRCSMVLTWEFGSPAMYYCDWYVISLSLGMFTKTRHSDNMVTLMLLSLLYSNSIKNTRHTHLSGNVTGHVAIMVAFLLLHGELY